MTRKNSKAACGLFIRSCGGAVIGVALSAIAPLARGDQSRVDAPSASELSLARDQFHAGIDAAKAGDWDAARQAFERSYQLAPRTITLFNLAGSQLQTLHFLSAAESYRRFLREASSGPAADQRETAKQELARAEGHVAHLSLSVQGLKTDDRLLLDGDAIPAAAIAGLEIPIDPGDHVVAISRGGAEVQRQIVHLKDHESRAVSLLVPPSPPVKESAPSALESRPTDASRIFAPVPDIESRSDDSGRHSVLASPWFWTAVGVVVAGGVTAAVVASRSSSAATPYAGNIAPGSLVIP